jgi:hypothetical protein
MGILFLNLIFPLQQLRELTLIPFSDLKKDEELLSQQYFINQV